MLKLIKCGPIQFKKNLYDKKIYIFGAGRALESCLDIYFSNHHIEAIIDNNNKIWGKTVRHIDQEIKIISLSEFLHEFKNDNIILFISSQFYAGEIVEQLDKVDKLNGVETYLQVLIRNTKEDIPDFEFSVGEQKIPKKIHYIWVGNNQLPDEYKKNVETWKKFNPDYEIIRWDESNYDFNKCRYVKQAYESKSWGFVPNYARLDILYHNGGIYLDADVEVIRNFDCLLNDEAFFNMGSADRINQGCGFGCIAGSEIVKEMMSVFEKTDFYDEFGNATKKPCNSFINPVIKKYGFLLENMYQKINNIVVYPCSIMSPKTLDGMDDYYCKKTLSVHKEAGTWKNEKEKKALEKIYDLIKFRIGR